MDGATREGGAIREGKHDERVGEKVQTMETTMTEMTETETTTKTVTMTLTINDDDDDSSGNSKTSQRERGATREALT